MVGGLWGVEAKSDERLKEMIDYAIGGLDCRNGHVWIWSSGSGHEAPDWLTCVCGEMTYGEVRRIEARRLLANDRLMNPIWGWLLLTLMLVALVVAAS